MPGKPAEFDQRADVLAFGLRVQDVLIGAGYEIDRAAEQGVERLRPAFEVDDRDVEPVIPEIAAAFGQRDREIIKVRLVGHAKPE